MAFTGNKMGTKCELMEILISASAHGIHLSHWEAEPCIMSQRVSLESLIAFMKYVHIE